MVANNSKLDMPRSEIKRPFDSEEPQLPPQVCFWGERLSSRFSAFCLSSSGSVRSLSKCRLARSEAGQLCTGGFLAMWKPKSPTSPSTAGSSCRASEHRGKSDFSFCVTSCAHLSAADFSPENSPLMWLYLFRDCAPKKMTTLGKLAVGGFQKVQKYRKPEGENPP